MDSRPSHVNHPRPTRRIIVDGASSGAFDRGDWALTLAAAGLWGSSFVWIAIGLDSLDWRIVAFGRVALGAACLWVLPSARRSIPRSVWPTIVVIAVAGNAAPALLFAFAQQSVDSSVAAMINSAAPIAVVAIGMLLTRRSPGAHQLAGISIGFLGVAAIAAPSVVGADATPSGIAVLAVAVVGYALSNNVIVTPQRLHGAVPVVARALALATALLAPFAATGRNESEFTTGGIVAVTVLGVGGTGIARALNATLAGRTGAARGSITTYLVPVIAIVLGVAVRDDTIRPIQLAGLIIVLAAAWLTTRSVRLGTPRARASVASI